MAADGGLAIGPRWRLRAPGAGGGGARNVAIAVSLALHAGLLAVHLPQRPAPAEAPAPAAIAVRLLPPEPHPAEPQAETPPPKPAPKPAAKPAARPGAHPKASPTARKLVTAARSASTVAAADGEEGGEVGDLNYRRFYDENPKHPMRCMVGHVAQSSGDHESAVYIYSDCAARGDNFSLLSLAVYYEVGLGGLPRDPVKAAEIFHSIATGKAEAYAANGMFYYGLALYYGLGVARDEAAGLDWLARASDKGDRDAAEFISLAQAGKVPDSSRYFRR